MKILVCISIVPDTTVKVKVENNNINYNDIPLIINPNDEICLSKVIKFKNDNNAEVTVLNVGLERNDNMIRRCLSMGGDNAVRIESEASDTFSVSKLISNYVKENNYDIILFGKESIDFNSRVVYNIVSGITEIDVLNNVYSFDIEGNSLDIKLERGNKLIYLKSKFPVIISGDKSLIDKEDIIIPNMRGIMASRQKEIEIINYNNENMNFYKGKKYTTIDNKKECEFFDSVDKVVEILENYK